jgi:hypothetical protein
VKAETPRWLKKLARERMAQTGERYTVALRKVREERAARSAGREATGE